MDRYTQLHIQGRNIWVVANIMEFVHLGPCHCFSSMGCEKYILEDIFEESKHLLFYSPEEF